jgi:hypothetical protein
MHELSFLEAIFPALQGLFEQLYSQHWFVV